MLINNRYPTLFVLIVFKQPSHASISRQDLSPTLPSLLLLYCSTALLLYCSTALLGLLLYCSTTLLLYCSLCCYTTILAILLYLQYCYTCSTALLLYAILALLHVFTFFSIFSIFSVSCLFASLLHYCWYPLINNAKHYYSA